MAKITKKDMELEIAFFAENAYYHKLIAKKNARLKLGDDWRSDTEYQACAAVAYATKNLCEVLGINVSIVYTSNQYPSLQDKIFATLDELDTIRAEVERVATLKNR